MRSINSDEVAPIANVVRCDMFKSQLIRQDPENPNDLLLTDFSAYDFKGNFPARLSNMLLGSIIPKGCDNIYSKIKEQEKKNSS